jgi:hypothetical protein
MAWGGDQERRSEEELEEELDEAVCGPRYSEDERMIIH